METYEKYISEGRGGRGGQEFANEATRDIIKTSGKILDKAVKGFSKDNPLIGDEWLRKEITKQMIAYFKGWAKD